jgi:hypothetical protein
MTSLPTQIHEPIERAPRLVRMLKTIDPRCDTASRLVAGELVIVKQVEADRRGVEVVTPAGAYVSLHPSEFVVVQWADAMSL